MGDYEIIIKTKLLVGDRPIVPMKEYQIYFQWVVSSLSVPMRTVTTKAFLKNITKKKKDQVKT